MSGSSKIYKKLTTVPNLVKLSLLDRPTIQNCVGFGFMILRDPEPWQCRVPNKVFFVLCVFCVGIKACVGVFFVFLVSGQTNRQTAATST
jgi:hypothetical protein